jgi:nitrate reductase gamma subunit
MESCVVGAFILVFMLGSAILASPVAALVGGIAYLIQRHRDQSERLSRSVVAAVLALTLLVALACLGLLVWNPRI